MKTEVVSSTIPNDATVVASNEIETCGIIMPIADMLTYTAQHWLDVRSIIAAAIAKANFTPKMVSDSDDIGVILRRIVTNIYYNPIVVCDVSGKNPNVMFELGLRLAFDKPVVIIKDDETDYSFDTSVIEHLDYPRDLRYQNIQSFIDKLAKKIQATHQKKVADKDYSPFVKHFGSFEIKDLERKDGTVNDVLLQKIVEIQEQLNRLSTRQPTTNRTIPLTPTLINSMMSDTIGVRLPEKTLKDLVNKVVLSHSFPDIDSYFKEIKSILDIVGYNYSADLVKKEIVQSLQSTDLSDVLGS